MITGHFKAVLFDLDGTLVDTAPDLGFALNSLLQEHQRPTLDFARIRPVASHGSAGLLKLGFGITDVHPAFKSMQARFIEIYAANISRESAIFPGMDMVLDGLTEAGIRWGIVTNKPAFLTEPLVDALGLNKQAACVVSGDTTAYSKPHPAPLLKASELLDLTPADCIYVGDAARDVEAAHAASMRCVVAKYGYLGEEDQPQNWHADCLINHPHEILEWI